MTEQIDAAVQYNRARDFSPSTWRDIQEKIGAIVDGVPGPATAEAVCAYQKAHNLSVDGKVGSDTLESLGIWARPVKRSKYDIQSLQERFPNLCFGIDVSNYQGVIDWKPVHAAGVKFVIVKATEGRTHQQSAFGRNMQGSSNYGIPRTAYHLARLTDSKVTKVMDPIGGAENFMSLLCGYHVDLVPFLDLEHKQVEQMVDLRGKEDAIEWIQKWIHHFESKTGGRLGLYLSHRTARLIGAPPSLVSRSTWWAYYKSATWGEEPKRGKGWNSWMLRQFTSHGNVPGISGHVDLNYTNGDVQQYLSEHRY